MLNRKVLVLALLALVGYELYQHPPIETIGRQQIGIRVNGLTGSVSELGEGICLMIPGIHSLRTFPLQDQIYRPEGSAKANGAAPFQSSEGLSIGVELAIRYAVDSTSLPKVARKLPDDIGRDLVEPLVQGVIYKVFTRYTVREIFSTKRQEIQTVIEAELKPMLAADGIVLRNVMMGNVDLPPDYRDGMNKVLATELQTEQMQYTLQLKTKQVEESKLQAEADKARSDTAAEAAANEQVIAAKGQEEAMKHVLPFKRKQIEQRELEAEADSAARIRTAKGAAEARRIEASGEADSRRKLADAEAYRLEQIGKVNSEQLERDGVLIDKHPLLIQKTLADKLSDKISVIIAPPPAAGGFIGQALIDSKQQAAGNNAGAAQ
ncbi:SPFH domain-containing protein [Rhodanobacter sp. AS-Z3]|uniref:SPFH domain-containing protein n=1 Tax=Rhodanobacter sp. AS-Z3 TaxID=3031330 RepID=UPI0024787A5C|nr:SPFH domain-containing protein [Rhodanobacter sp. AS-Z3]WEN13959.1 SPFH domain-containing protein [Rhodanobacter sp. AS-Z3]